MQQNTAPECPRCGRRLDRFNGHIGYCSQHQWVSARGLSYDAEAAQRNQQDADERQRQAEEAEAQAERERRQRAMRRLIAVVAALALIAVAVVLFVVRPGMNYGYAAERFAAGDYQAARDAYQALGGYQDAAQRVVLCDAMLDLQSGRPEDAVTRLDRLTADGQDALARQLADTLLPMVSDWQAKGLTPQALLLLLDRTSVIDPNGTLDVARLSGEGHAALLDGSQLATDTRDVNGDGQPELIALNPDYSVTVYRMTADSNARIAVDNAVAAACEMAFGDLYQETDVSAAIACYAEAVRLAPDDSARAALANAYRLRSAGHENAGDMDAAIADAKSALDTAGTADAFTYYYDVNLRHCRNGHDAATALAMWAAFADGHVAELTRFSANDRWQADAAQLHLARAAELAAQQDEGCIAELRAAAGMGADVTGAVAEATSQFEPGLSLVRLRLFALELPGADERQIRADMADEVRAAIGEWQARGIAPADVPALIRLADDQGIDLTGVDRDAAYEEAAVASAGSVAQYSLVDWDADGYQELLALDASGILRLYGTEETWKAISSIDTRMPGCAYVIADDSAPLILAVSAGQDELLALTGTGTQLSALFRETGLCRYRANGSTVTFSRLLEGSITRYNDYTYEAVGTDSRPVRTGIDWQQNDYPQPENALAAVQRYFEARAYDIPDEAALLTAAPAVPGMFTPERLNALTPPDVPGTVEAAAYDTQEDRAWFEVTYPAQAQTVRAWIAVEYSDGWKLAGAADTYGAGQDPQGMDMSIQLISLNAETVNTLSARGGRSTYRLLVPSPGRIGLTWQSGSKAASRTSHTVTMVRGALTGDTVFSFSLQPSPNKQQSKDMFVSAGVYYVTVEAKIADAEAYHLTITFDAETHVELENNDTSVRATAMELNTGYSGTLSSAKDVDYYSFTLDETSAVNVTFGTPGSGGRTATHTLTVYRAADGSRLSTVSVPGSAQLTETGNLYLSPGTYLVQVAKGNASTDDVYTLTVKAGRNGHMESEPNNTPETANPVPVNEDIHASIGVEGDIDCFAFTLDADAVIQPRFTFTPTDSSSRTYVLTVTDAHRRELLKVNIGGKESTKVIAPVALAAGTYTVKIENPRFVRQDYTLRLVSMAVPAAEQEPNESAALATLLTPGQPRTGVLSAEADIDYYRVTFAELTTVTLKFSFAQSTSRSTAFVLTVEQNGKTQWTASIKGDSGGVEQQLQFPAGEYYIRVKPSTWLGTVYTISLE